MAIVRFIDPCVIGADWCVLQGMLRDVPFGESCPTTVPHISFQWRKRDAALTSGEQSQVDAVRTMLQAYLDAEESCADLRATYSFYLTLGAGLVRTATVWLNGPTVAGKQRQVWGRWTKQRTAFTEQEQTALDAVVAMLAGYLATEEPL